MHEPASPPTRLLLRELPLAARLTLAVFLIAVGLGYVAALVNLHFQEASPGEFLPTLDDVRTGYSGKPKVSQLERLLTANPHLPFNGQGSMRSAFTRRRVGGWTTLVKNKAKELKLDRKNPANETRLREEVERDLDGERRALVEWVRGGLKEEYYEKDRFPLKGELAKVPITRKFVDQNANGERFAKVASIFNTRCVRCHSEGVGGPGAQYPLDKYEEIAEYAKGDVPSGKSLPHLSLTTHVHLLGFTLLYGLTGVIFALSGYPSAVRVLVAPLPLLAQLADISCWWLARLDPPYGAQFASAIPVTGLLVAVGLGIHVVLGLFSLFGRGGKVVVFLLLVGAALGGGLAWQKVVVPYVAQEKARAATNQ
jgi:hypothetical protein